MHSQRNFSGLLVIITFDQVMKLKSLLSQKNEFFMTQSELIYRCVCFSSAVGWPFECCLLFEGVAG